MKKWTLILILAAVVFLLFMWSIREHFDTYEDALADVGQSTGYTDLTKPKCPSGYVYHSESGKCKSPSGEVAPNAPLQTSKESTDKCAQEISTKSWDEVSEECKKQAVEGPSLIPQPNSGGSSLPMGVRKGNIFGPAYTGVGDNSGDGLGSGIREYPTLLGPQPKESTMVEGAGISKPSIHTQLSKPGALPSSSSTGSSEESKFFGASRLPASSPGATSTSPGDQDMYPGFFGGAGSTAYTASSGSSKTDPAPFLSDFSAFLK